MEWFRQYLVIEFAEEGIDLLVATRDMLDRHRLHLALSNTAEQDCRNDKGSAAAAVVAGGKGEGEGGEEREGGGRGGGDERSGEGGGGGGGGDAAASATAAAASVEAVGEEPGAAAGAAEAKPEAGEGAETAAAASSKDGEGSSTGEFDIRKVGKDLYERFIKSGCGSECNLPGTVVSKVREGHVSGMPKSVRACACLRACLCSCGYQQRPRAPADQ